MTLQSCALGEGEQKQSRTDRSQRHSQAGSERADGQRTSTQPALDKLRETVRR